MKNFQKNILALLCFASIAASSGSLYAMDSLDRYLLISCTCYDNDDNEIGSRSLYVHEKAASENPALDILPKCDSARVSIHLCMPGGSNSTGPFIGNLSDKLSEWELESVSGLKLGSYLIDNDGMLYPSYSELPWKDRYALPGCMPIVTVKLKKGLSTTGMRSSVVSKSSYECSYTTPGRNRLSYSIYSFVVSIVIATAYAVYHFLLSKSSGKSNKGYKKQ